MQPFLAKGMAGIADLKQSLLVPISQAVAQSATPQITPQPATLQTAPLAVNSIGTPQPTQAVPNTPPPSYAQAIQDSPPPYRF